MLLQNLAERELQFGRGHGIVGGQGQLALDDLGQILPLLGGLVESTEGAQCLQVVGIGLEDVAVERQCPLDVVNLLFVEKRELETNFALLVFARGQAEFLVVDGK